MACIFCDQTPETAEAVERLKQMQALFPLAPLDGLVTCVANLITQLKNAQAHVESLTASYRKMAEQRDRLYDELSMERSRRDYAMEAIQERAIRKPWFDHQPYYVGGRSKKERFG